MLRVILSIIVLTCFINYANSKKFYIGAVFSSFQSQEELAFRAGIKEANRMLQNHQSDFMDKQIRYEFVANVTSVEEFDSFIASQKTCSLLESLIIAMLGPTDPVAADQVQSITSQFGIPFLDMTPVSLQPIQRRLSINLYPHFSNIMNCIQDYISAQNWRRMSIIYTDSRDLIKFHDLINKVTNQQMILNKISFDGSEKYLMKYLQSKHYFHFIVDIPYWRFADFMKLVTYYNMTTQYYSFLFVNWDIQLLNLENFTTNNAANITTLSLFPIEKQKSKDKFMLELQKEVYEMQKRKHNTEIFTFLTTETAIIYESMRLLAMAFIQLTKLNALTLSTKLSCDAAYSWGVGVSLFNSCHMVVLDSPMGTDNQLRVNEEGWVDNFQISVSRLQNKSYFESYGFWNKKDGLTITKARMTKDEVNFEISQQTLRVVTIIDPPFVISKQVDPNGLTSKHPDNWSGFCIELLKKIAADLKFNYTIEEVADKKYGNPEFDEATGKAPWNGLVGALMSYKADLAMSSLTITYDRERAIDFTTPYMNLGISIIFKRPAQKDAELFAFLSPLSKSVWGYVIMSYISVSFVLFVIGRFSPFEWYNPSPCQENNPFHSNQFNILNSMWFTIGSFMQQGTDIVPKATSTRIVAGVWWFFVLIIISSYTANLAAFLTLARMKVPIENAEDLSKQTRIGYGTVKGGSTSAFFRKSTFPVYQKMNKFMNSTGNMMVNTNEEGINRVRTKDYAFILESTTNEFYTRRQCDLVRIGGLLDSKGYGIGLPQGSRYRDVLSESILKLQKAQEIEKLRRYYWRDYNNEAVCLPKVDKVQTSSLGIKETGGVFVMLFSGALASIVVAFIEMFFKSWKRSKVKKTPICSEASTLVGSNLRKLCNHCEDGEDDDEFNEDTQRVEADDDSSASSVGAQVGHYTNNRKSQSPSPKVFSAIGHNNIGRELPLHGTSNYGNEGHEFNNEDGGGQPASVDLSQLMLTSVRPASGRLATMGNHGNHNPPSNSTSFDYAVNSEMSPALRPSSPLYHLPPAMSGSAKVAPMGGPLASGSSGGGHPNLGYKTVFKDNHSQPLPVDDTIQPPSYDSLSGQVRLKKVAC